MFGLREAREAVLYGVVIDVGSASVGVAIVSSDQSKELPTTLFSHRAHIRTSERSVTLKERVRQIREALFAASLILSRDGIQALVAHDPHARIKKVLITCSSPWAYTIARTIQYEGDTEMKVTRTLIDDLVKSAENDLDTHLETTNLPQDLDFQIVERSTVDVRINDYPVHEPVGLKGTSLALTHITGLVPKDIIETVYEVQDKIFTEAELRAHTSMLVSYCVLRDMYPQFTSFCVVSITGETTEFGIVENGTLIRSIFAPYGIGTLIQGIMRKTRSSETDVMSTLEAYTANDLDKATTEKIESALQEYAETVRTSLTDDLAHDHIPKNIIFITDAGIEHVLKRDLLAAIHTFTGEEHQVTVVDSHTTVADTGDADPDTYLALGCRFFHKLHGCGEIDSH